MNWRTVIAVTTNPREKPLPIKDEEPAVSVLPYDLCPHFRKQSTFTISSNLQRQSLSAVTEGRCLNKRGAMQAPYYDRPCVCGYSAQTKMFSLPHITCKPSAISRRIVA
jgi:hypothetical protein